MRAQSYNPKDCSPPDSSAHGLFQAERLEWVAISFSSQTFLLLICTDLINKKRGTEINYEMWDDTVTEFIKTLNVKTSFQKYISRYVCMYVCALSRVRLFVIPGTVARQTTLCPWDFPGWVAISFSRGSFRPRDQTCISCVPCIGRWLLYLMSHQQSPSIDEAPSNKILHYKTYNPVKVDTS